MGELMRYYWHPIAPAAMLNDNPVRKVKILGEELVLYRDLSGRLGLIGPRCAHRLVHMELGIPDLDGLRCPYHGWCYDQSGRCVETPLEAPNSRLKERIQIPSYPVRELGGLVFAYLGPEPAPVLPPWDFLVWPNSIRHIAVTIIPCNWLQCHENSVDPTHTVYLHGHFFKYALERKGLLKDRAFEDSRQRVNVSTRVTEGGYDGVVAKRDQYGLRKGLKYSQKRGALADNIQGINSSYNIFPYYSRLGPPTFRTQVNMRVPLDDTHTYHLNYVLYHVPGVEAPPQEVIPYYWAPMWDENGEPILDYVLAQDMAAWAAQGPITDRTAENLGGSDVAIREFRRLIADQLTIVEGGGEPINVFRDEREVGDCIALTPSIGGTGTLEGPLQKVIAYRNLMHKGFFQDDVDRYSPVLDLVQNLLAEAEALDADRQEIAR